MPCPEQVVLISETSGSNPGHTLLQSSDRKPVVSREVTGIFCKEPTSLAPVRIRLPVIGSVSDKNFALSHIQEPVSGVHRPRFEQGISCGEPVSSRLYQKTLPSDS